MPAMAWFWLAVALAFGVGEVSTLAFYALFVVLGALAAAASAQLGLGLGGEVIVFAVVSVLGVLAARPPLMRYLQRREGPLVRSGAESMIGELAPVVEAIVDAHRPGHVELHGERWPALSDDSTAIPVGSTVRITGLRQATLLVARVVEAQPHLPPGSPATKEG